jgi:hypothetical protein
MINTDTTGVRGLRARDNPFRLGRDSNKKFKNYLQSICKPALDENSKEHSLKDRPRSQTLPSASNLIENILEKIQVSPTR